MALPIANAGASPAPYEFGATPASVVLNGSGTPGTGAASITVYQWTILFDDGVAAALDDATDPAATLTGLPPEGSVRLFLRVTDNLGQQSEQDPTKAPNSAFILFSTKTEHLGVERVADGERDWGEKYRVFIDAVEDMRADVDSFVAVAPPRTVYVTATPGDSDADGTIARPFNPTSAAANDDPFSGLPFVGPIRQGIVALMDMDMSDNPQEGCTLHIAPGSYDEDIIIANAVVPWTIIHGGQVVIAPGNKIAYTPALVANILYRPNLRIVPGPRGAYLINQGALELNNPNAGETVSFVLEQVTAASAGTTGHEVGGILLARELNCSGAFNIPNIEMVHLVDAGFGGALTARDVYTAARSSFEGNVTLSALAGGDGSGFYDCAWGSNVVFSAPDGCARFDPVTASRFFDKGGSLTGGCTPRDYIDQNYSKYARAPVEMTGPQGGDANFDLGSFLEFGVRPGSILEIDVIFYAAVDGPSDGFKLGIALSNATGGQAIEIIKQTDLLGVGVHANIHVKATVMFDTVGDPCDIGFEGHSVHSNPPIVTVASNYNQLLDTDPPVCRVQARMFLDGGTFGIDSSARVLAMNVSHRRGRT